jgi:carbamoyl-phosphate synthase large subunit
MRILVTGASAPGSNGTAWSLLRPNLFDEKVTLFGSDAQTLFTNKYFKTQTKLPHGSSGDYLEKLEKLCIEEGIELIVPQTTAETIKLSNNHDSISTPIALLSNREELVSLASKIDVYAALSETEFVNHDFKVCRNIGEIEEFRASFGEDNFFIKADDLSGGRGIVKIVHDISTTILSKSKSFHVATEKDLHHLFDVINVGKGVIVQKESKGIEYSIDCYRDESLSICLPRSRDVVRAGVSQETTLVNQVKLIEFAKKFGEMFDLIGVFGLQCILNNDESISFLECNPRVQGTMVASTVAGENIIGRGARLALGLSQEPEQEVAWGTVYRRSWGGMGIVGGQSHEI